MTSTTRLLELLSLLQARRDWPGPALAARLEVDPRTIRRDIDRLREMGYRIQATAGRDGGYRLDAGSELPPLLFDEDQTVAVAVALQSSPALGTGLEEAALRALGTIRQVMPSKLRHRLDAFDVTAIVRTGAAPAGDVSADALTAIARAIHDRVVLRFAYAERRAGGDSGEHAAADPEPRRVEPHHLATSDGRWYLVAWDLARDDWRIFRVDRVSPSAHTGPEFHPRQLPAASVAEFLAARFHGSASGTWPCRGAVVLERAARDVLPFVGDGVVTEIDAGSCRLELGSWSWGSLAAAFGRFDAPMRVVGPPQLAEACAALAQRFAAAAAPER
ncbi:helix-turn-helix transcriptional regulator [Leucobacter japonicus]|uniref:helix-turn-helix transcriptional regulator n=1 Tax=Leucobacter japonicus TaxID=1461259 RepID=UPI0006A7B145|nr:WYL domain-containing protein [Leucobacter japonicus]